MAVEAQILEKSTLNNRSEFEELFRTHYRSLCAFANKYLNDADASEEIVQEIFVKLWKNKDNLSITSSLKSYLFTSVRNGSLNLIKHIKIREEYKIYNQADISHQEKVLVDAMEVSELDEKIRKAIDQLPTERKKIFIMSRYDGLKYREIAEELGISVKTVENQMGKAMAYLRVQLSEYLSIAILLFFEMLNNK